MSPRPKIISLLRVGNPWMVGGNVSRIVPVHTLQSFLSTLYEKSEAVQEILELARGTPNVDAFACYLNWRPNPAERVRLQHSVFALLAPDRRVFRSNSSAQGSLTPLLAGFATPTPSDDGLGKRMSALLLSHRCEYWRAQLDAMLIPEKAADPATAAALTLLGGKASAGRKEDPEALSRALKEHEKDIADFVIALIRGGNDSQRLLGIQEFGRGLYFGAVWLLITQNVKPEKRNIFVYAGMPPGTQSNPAVLAAAKSFERVIDHAWSGLSAVIAQKITRARIPTGTPARSEYAERVRAVLGDDVRENQAQAIVDALKPPGRKSWPEWVDESLEDSLGFSRAEMTRRVRSLGANIGLAGPDAGRALPRFYCETPLLGTLVRGICGDSSMSLDEFVKQVRIKFGIVFGSGGDDRVLSSLGPIWSGGDGEDLLERNEEELGRRLVKAGLARTYSDSHTEVFARG